MKSEVWLTWNEESTDGFHFLRLHLVSVAPVVVAFGSTFDWRASGGLLAAVVEVAEGILRPSAVLEGSAVDRRGFIGGWLTCLPVGLTSAVRFRGWVTPTLDLLPGGTGAGFVLGVKDWVRDSVVPQRSTLAGNVPTTLVLVLRTLVLALGRTAALAGKDMDSQRDTDVLAAEDFGLELIPLDDFLTMNWFAWESS